MKRLASSIILCSLLLFCACESAIEDYGRGNDGTLLVNLDISVALSDVSTALTRATKDADAANENEKMHTLRVVIVRPDWTVEANRLIDLKAAATLQHQVAEPFPVVGNEQKLIYLFVNEGTTAINKVDNISRKLLDFDLSKIEVGYYFPINTIEGLKIKLEDNTEQIEGPLPMSERHEYFVNKEPQQSCNLFVTRAAVKFTFHIINNSANSITLNGVTINKMAQEEWYIPRAKYSEPNKNGQREIIEYEVPAGVGYYTYGEETFVKAMTVNAGGKRVLDPIYLLESKYIDDPDSEGRNYSMKININSIQKKLYLPELNTLPRNTHVVVNITFNKDATVSYEVDVIPYSEVPLEPDFGL